MMWQNKTRPNKTAKVAYAYKPSDNDPLVIIPDQERVDWVEKAIDHLDQGHSSRQVASWLTEKTGDKISLQGIFNIWRTHRGTTSKQIKKLDKETKRKRPKTSTDKKLAAAKRKMSDAKRMLTITEKKIAKLEGKD